MLTRLVATFSRFLAICDGKHANIIRFIVLASQWLDQKYIWYGLHDLHSTTVKAAGSSLCTMPSVDARPPSLDEVKSPFCRRRVQPCRVASNSRSCGKESIRRFNALPPNAPSTIAGTPTASRMTPGEWASHWWSSQCAVFPTARCSSGLPH